MDSVLNVIREENKAFTVISNQTSPLCPAAANGVLETINKEVSSLNTQENILDKFKRSILDQTKNYPPPVSVVDIYNCGQRSSLLTLKSFSLWQGKEKSKKTTALAILIAHFIKGFISDDNFLIPMMNGSVLWFDTEQGESYAARTMKLILKIAGLDQSNKLVYCDLREFSPTERKKIIAAGIEATPDAKIVVIDGMVDLMVDFMDAGEGHLTVTDILKWCTLYDVHIAGVLHQNKNDKNARAHIGTISTQKCEMQFATEVDTNDRAQSIVSCVSSRNIPFEPFAIRWDKGSLPCIATDYNSVQAKEAKSNKNFERSKEVAEAIFTPLAALSHTEAIKALMNATLKSESTAKRLLNDLLMWDIISKAGDGNYRIKTKVHGFKEGSNEGL